MHLRLFLLRLFCASLVALPLSARAEERGSQAGAAAIGRLEIDGSAFCTAVLLSGDALLTAAHCLFDPATGARLPEAEMRFRATGAEGRRILSAQIHPAFVYEAGPGPERIRHDLAVLRIAGPGASGALAIGPLPVAGSAVAVPGGADTGSALAGCRVSLETRGLLVLSCAAEFGASGAPVLAMSDDGPRLVALVAARAQANGVPVSLGAGLAPLRDWLERAAAAAEAAPR